MYFSNFTHPSEIGRRKIFHQLQIKDFPCRIFVNIELQWLIVRFGRISKTFEIPALEHLQKCFFTHS